MAATDSRRSTEAQLPQPRYRYRQIDKGQLHIYLYICIDTYYRCLYFQSGVRFSLPSPSPAGAVVVLSCVLAACLVRRTGGMASQRPARKWGATDAALVLAAAAIVPKWSRWLNERQTERKRVEGEDGEEEEWVLYRPTSGVHLAQGFGTTFGYLALLDLLVARRAVDQTSRFFILHTLANIAITIAATPDAVRSLTRPFHEPIGKMSILPVYLIAGLFTYHLSVFSNVPREECVRPYPLPEPGPYLLPEPCPYPIPSPNPIPSPSPSPSPSPRPSPNRNPSP